MEPHRPISVFMHDAEGMPNERTFGMGKMRLRVGILVYNPTLGSNSYDRVVYSPTVRKCKSSCNWDGERLEIWCRNSCFLQNGWELLVILFHESEYVDNSVVGTVQIPLADLTNCAPERNDRIQYQVISHSYSCYRVLLHSSSDSSAIRFTQR